MNEETLRSVADVINKANYLVSSQKKKLFQAIDKAKGVETDEGEEKQEVEEQYEETEYDEAKIFCLELISHFLQHLIESRELTGIESQQTTFVIQDFLKEQADNGYFICTRLFKK